MIERLKDTTSPVPNKNSQSNAQPLSQTHPPDRAAPLHERLPLEIFIAIMHLCVGFSTPVRDLVTLQLVCRSWHEIIAGASFLWGTINADEGLPAVRKALQMVKDSLIDLTFMDDTSKITQTRFYELARGKLNQWRSFVAESDWWQSALDDLRTQKPPKLDTLHVETRHCRLGGDEEFVIFGGDPTPGLRDVRLANVCVSRAPLHLSGLKSLRLERIPSVSAAEVITIITGSPGLEILHLDRLDGAVLPTDATSGQANFAFNAHIELAFLIELRLFCLNLTFLSHLLSTLTFPQLRSLRIGCELDKNPNPALQLGETAGLNRLNLSMSSIASGAQVYKVTISSWGYYVFSIGGLDITVYPPTKPSVDHFHESFTWLSGHLEKSLHDLPLHLKLVKGDPESSYLEWFTCRTKVIALTLNSDLVFGEVGLGRLIRTISQPTPPTPSSPTWLLPQVEVLYANCIGAIENIEIVDMIERRQSASRESFGAGVNGALPKRLREVWLAGAGLIHGFRGLPPDTEFLSKVVQAAAGADVYWEGKKWIGS